MSQSQPEKHGGETIQPLTLKQNGTYFLLSTIPISLSYLIAYFLSTSSSSNSNTDAFSLNDIIYWNFFIQTAIAVLSIIFQTEKYYDLTGSLTYIILTSFSYYQAASSSSHSTSITSSYRLVLSIFTLCWAVRLGSFLFYRVMKHGSDSRFEKVKRRPLQFFFYWMMQGLWIFLTALPTFWINTVSDNELSKDHTFSVLAYIGFSSWLVGFLFESIADYQKFAFRQLPDNHGKFISTGLWSLSRHPNYFGEILCWVSIYISLLPILSGKLYILLAISPIFVYVLLTQMSGIPILEKQGSQRWGHLPQYQNYKKNTPVLFPRLF